MSVDTSNISSTHQQDGIKKTAAEIHIYIYYIYEIFHILIYEIYMLAVINQTNIMGQ